MPKHLIFCISGFSGTGKDEIANRLVSSHESSHFGLVDEAKRHMASLYGFSYDQLFGPSESRSRGDPRFPKSCFLDLKAEKIGVFGVNDVFDGVVGHLVDGVTYYKCEGRFGDTMDKVPYRPLKMGNAEHFIANTHPRFFLSPRECLQKYCNLMQDLYENTWIRKAMDQALDSGAVTTGFRYRYDRMSGRFQKTDVPIRDMNFTFSCFSDFRHWHEVRYAKTMRDSRNIPILVRVKRPGIEKPPFDHRSETEQAIIPDSEFHEVINNDGTLEDLWEKVDNMVQKVKEKA